MLVASGPFRLSLPLRLSVSALRRLGLRARSATPSLVSKPAPAKTAGTVQFRNRIWMQSGAAGQPALLNGDTRFYQQASNLLQFQGKLGYSFEKYFLVCIFMYEDADKKILFEDVS